MIFTPAQQIIIKDICSLQFQVLEKILIEPILGKAEDEDDFTIEEMLAMHGCDRKDFDKGLIDAYEQFQKLHKDPDKLFELGRYEMAVFIQILHVLEDDMWKDTYPNALLNLWNKIFIWETTNEMRN
jgi:hypothetical protein